MCEVPAGWPRENPEGLKKNCNLFFMLLLLVAAAADAVTCCTIVRSMKLLPGKALPASGWLAGRLSTNELFFYFKLMVK